MTIKSKYKCSVEPLPIGHPAREEGYEYEIEVQGKFKNEVFYSLHYCTEEQVPVVLNWINSDLYLDYIETQKENEEWTQKQ